MGAVNLIKGLKLYKYSEYPVVVGNAKSTVALCVVWQSLDTVVKYFPEFIKKFAIVGNLRSSFGVNVILYNLALNPHIRKIVLWGPDKLSNTAIGISGKQTLLNVWKSKGKTDTLVKEINADIFTLIQRNVVVEDRSGQTKLETKHIGIENEIPYMKPHAFPELIVKTPEIFPSEGYMYPIREKKGADGFLSLLSHIFRYGSKTRINQEGEEVKEIRGAVVCIENEDPSNIYFPEWLLQTKGFNISEQSLTGYYESQFTADPYKKEIFPRVFTFKRPRDYSYLYAEQIFAYPRPVEIDATVFHIYKLKSYRAAKKYILEHSSGNKSKVRRISQEVERTKLKQKKKLEILLEALIPRIDQIEYVIDRIKRKKDDLDKEVILWDVRRHTRLESGRPCIMKFSFLVRNGSIDVHVFARSHDIASAWFYNFFGVARLLGKIATETNYMPGRIIMESESAHIYKRDWEFVGRLLKKQIEDKDPRMYFNPELDSDPRGIINITTEDSVIKIKLQDTKTGSILFETKGATARELLYKIKHLQLISRIDHGIFIGGELAKAEMCIKLKIPYKYDQPIELPGGEKIIT